MKKYETIITDLNKRFGTNFDKSIIYCIEQLKIKLISKENLIRKANLKSIEDFRTDFETAFVEIVKNLLDQNLDFFIKIINEHKFLIEDILPEIYKLLRDKALI